MEREPSVETTEGYEKFLQNTSMTVLGCWVYRGGDIPKGTGDKLQQDVITALDRVFAGVGKSLTETTECPNPSCENKA